MFSDCFHRSLSDFSFQIAFRFLSCCFQIPYMEFGRSKRLLWIWLLLWKSIGRWDQRSQTFDNRLGHSPKQRGRCENLSVWLNGCPAGCCDWHGAGQGRDHPNIYIYIYISQNHVSINEGACVACSSKFKDRNQKHSETKCQTGKTVDLLLFW